MTSKFDKEQAIAFLKVIDPGATRFSFQTFDDSPGKRPNRVRLLHGALDELWAGICRLSLYGAGVFVTINEADLSGRKAGNIVRVRALFADLDGAPLTNAWNVPLALGWVTRTSAGRYHLFWRVDGVALAEFTPLQKEIIDRTGGDRAIHDLPRVMRLPGFPHQKGKPYFVEGQAIEEGAAVNSRDACSAILPPTKAPTPVERHLARPGNGLPAQESGTTRSTGLLSVWGPSFRPAEFPCRKSRRF